MDASIYLGAEVGNTDTQRLEAGARLAIDQAWSASLQLARAEFELPDAQRTSTLLSAKAQYDFGAFGLGLGLRRGEVSEVSSSRGVTVGGFLDQSTWRLSAEIESRETDLAAAPFTEDLGTGAGVQNGISRCDVGSRGYQAQLDVNRPAWAAFVSYRAYDYDDFDCLVSITANGSGNGNGNGPPAHARGRALGRRLASLPLQPVQGFGSRLIPREAMLLDSSVALGVSLPAREQWIAGAELYRDRESIGGDSSQTLLAFANRRINAIWAVELTLGYSDAESVEDTAFAGVRVSADL